MRRRPNLIEVALLLGVLAFLLALALAPVDQSLLAPPTPTGTTAP